MKVFINRQELTRAYNELQKSTAGIHCFGDTTFVLTTDDNVRLEEGQLTPKPERKIGMPPALGAPYGASQVNHPSHYNSGKIEVIEALEDWNLNFCLANTVKYIARAGKKDPTKEIEDLEKARWYLNRQIEVLKAKKENREATRPNDMNPRS